MKTCFLTAAGGIENLVLQETDRPKLQSGEVLIEAKALSINPADVKVKYAEEGLNMLCGPERPIVLGWDIAGTVVEVGDGVSQLKTGDLALM